jgi:hypothetical protein
MTSNNDPIFSVLTGKPCVTNTAECPTGCGCPDGYKCCSNTPGGTVGTCIQLFGWQYYGFSSSEECQGVFGPSTCDARYCPGE